MKHCVCFSTVVSGRVVAFNSIKKESMALLLDDEEDYLPPAKTVKLEVATPHAAPSQTTSAEGSPAVQLNRSAPQEAVAAALQRTPPAPHSLPTTRQDTMATTERGVVFRVKGGNGVEKMAALAFGAPPVTVVKGRSGSSTTPHTVSAACVQSQQSSGKQATLGPVSSSASSALANTQPKVVSMVSSGSPLSSQATPSLLSLDATPRTSSHSLPLEEQQSGRTVSRPLLLDDEDAVGSTPSATSRPSPSSQQQQQQTSSSSSALTPQKTSNVSLSPPCSSKMSTQPPQTQSQPSKQMKLSDFFAKMTCKRPSQ